MQALDLRLLDAQCRDLGGEPFELGPHRVRVADLTRCEPAHERAAIRAQLDEPARLQLAQRLADRRSADAELLGERLLPESRSRRQVAVEDARLQLRRQLVDECPPFFVPDRADWSGRLLVDHKGLDPCWNATGSIVLESPLVPSPSPFPCVTVKNGGTLVVGLTAGEPDALDPTLARTFSGREVFLTFCEKLYDLNAKAQIVPQLASALPTISKDKLTVTIPLRKGIKFNDGTPFNADAVVKTLQRDLTLKGSARASEISPIDTVTANGAYTVVIHLKTPVLAADGAARRPRRDDHVADAARQARRQVRDRHRSASARSCSTAASPGDSITVTKSPFYYNKKNVHLDKIVFKVENDAAAAAAAALKAGDLQALDGTDSTQLAGVQGRQEPHDPEADGPRLSGPDAQHREQERPR